jgi:hypothetical protein
MPPLSGISGEGRFRVGVRKYGVRKYVSAGEDVQGGGARAAPSGLAELAHLPQKPLGEVELRFVHGGEGAPAAGRPQPRPFPHNRRGGRENFAPRCRRAGLSRPPLPRGLGEGSPAVARNERKAGGGEGLPSRSDGCTTPPTPSPPPLPGLRRGARRPTLGPTAPPERGIIYSGADCILRAARGGATRKTRERMSQADIPQVVRAFVAQNIESAELLETLLLVHSAPGREWSPEEVARSIYSVPAAAIRRLEQLAALGLVSSNGAADPAYRYAPSTPALAEQVDALAAAYRANRVAVINLVYATPPDPLRSFADAFKLRKD